MSDTKMTPRIVCSAIKRADGVIICGARHRDSTMRQIVNLTGGRESWIGAKQGFIDQRGNFLTREEALVIAKANNQIIRRCGGDEYRLYSENLY